jgi:hypothetical protein
MSEDWPKIWLIFATYKRTETALYTIRSLRDHLVYPNLHWHVADDGSGETDDGTNRWHVGVLTEEIAKFYPEVTWHEMDTPPGSFNTGGSVNKAILAARADGCDIHLLCFDDWALQRDLDIRPHVDVLDEYPSVGFIRLSFMMPWIGAYTIRYDPHRLNRNWMWWRVIRNWSLKSNSFKPGYEEYLVSTQPYVAHWRFFDVYGLHPENVNPGHAEIGLGHQYNRSSLGENGPQILFEIGPCVVHAPWGHMTGRAHHYAALFPQN